MRRSAPAPPRPRRDRACRGRSRTAAAIVAHRRRPRAARIASRARNTGAGSPSSGSGNADQRRHLDARCMLRVTPGRWAGSSGSRAAPRGIDMARSASNGRSAVHVLMLPRSRLSGPEVRPRPAAGNSGEARPHCRGVTVETSVFDRRPIPAPLDWRAPSACVAASAIAFAQSSSRIARRSLRRRRAGRAHRRRNIVAECAASSSGRAYGSPGSAPVQRARPSARSGSIGLRGSPGSVDPALPPCRPRRRHMARRTADTALRVGMRGRANTSVGRAALDDVAEIHDQDAVAQEAHDIEVVADEQVGEAEALLQSSSRLQDHDLDRDVERRGRLVEDQQVAARPRSPGRSRPAPSARPTADAESGRAVPAAARSAAPLPRSAARNAAPPTPRSRSSGSAMARNAVKRGLRLSVGVLEHHLDLRPRPAAPEPLAGIAPISAPSNRMLPSLGSIEAGQEAHQGRLAAARLADQPDRLAVADGEADAVDRMERSRPRARARHGLLSPPRPRGYSLRPLDREQRRPAASTAAHRRPRAHPAWRGSGSPDATPRQRAL